jgi:hypothetical protein
MIYKTFFGKHIDLSKVIAISDAYFIDRMGRGGYYVGFDITCQLLEKPISCTIDICTGECVRFDEELNHHTLLINGEFKLLRDINNKKDIQAVKNLQAKVDEIITAWKSDNYKRECETRGMQVNEVHTP